MKASRSLRSLGSRSPAVLPGSSSSASTSPACRVTLFCLLKIGSTIGAILMKAGPSTAPSPLAGFFSPCSAADKAPAGTTRAAKTTTSRATRRALEMPVPRCAKLDTPPRPVDHLDAAARLDAADRKDRQPQRSRQRRESLLGAGRRRKDQFIVIAAAENKRPQRLTPRQ